MANTTIDKDGETYLAEREQRRQVSSQAAFGHQNATWSDILNKALQDGERRYHETQASEK